jgi:hypothetical protein
MGANHPIYVLYVAHLKASTVRWQSLDGCHMGYTVCTEEVACYKLIGACILPKFCHIWIAVHVSCRRCFMSIKVLTVLGFILTQYIDIVLWLTKNVFNSNSKTWKWLLIIGETVQNQDKEWLTTGIYQAKQASGKSFSAVAPHWAWLPSGDRHGHHCFQWFPWDVCVALVDNQGAS